MNKWGEIDSKVEVRGKNGRRGCTVCSSIIDFN